MQPKSFEDFKTNKKPHKPDRKEPYPAILAVLALTIFIMLFIVFICSNTYKDRLMNEYRIECELNENRIVDYIKSIRPKYAISENNEVEVTIDIDIERDRFAENVGYQMYANFYVNDKIMSITADWLSDGTWRTKRIQDTALISIIDQNSIKTEIVDDDPDYPDEGVAVTKGHLRILDLNEGIDISQKIKVREYYGIWSGNEDIYNVHYKIKLSKPLRLTKTEIDGIPKFPDNPGKRNMFNLMIECIKEDGQCRKVLAIAGFLMGVFVIQLTTKVAKENKDAEKKYLQDMAHYNGEIDKFENEKKQLLKEINSKGLRAMASVPNNVLLRNDGLPYTYGSGYYGSYTVYISQNGLCYHRDPNCVNTGKMRSIHLFNAVGRYKPCKRCVKNTTMLVPQWYREYKELLMKCNFYGIQHDGNKLVNTDRKEN